MQKVTFKTTGVIKNLANKILKPIFQLIKKCRAQTHTTFVVVTRIHSGICSETIRWAGVAQTECEPQDVRQSLDEDDIEYFKVCDTEEEACACRDEFNDFIASRSELGVCSDVGTGIETRQPLVLTDESGVSFLETHLYESSACDAMCLCVNQCSVSSDPEPLLRIENGLVTFRQSACVPGVAYALDLLVLCYADYCTRAPKMSPYYEKQQALRQEAATWRLWAYAQNLTHEEWDCMAKYFYSEGRKYGLLKEFRRHKIC